MWFLAGVAHETAGRATYLAGGEAGQSQQGDSVRGLDLVVVRRVGESQRQHSLLLQIGLCLWEGEKRATVRQLEGGS